MFGPWLAILLFELAMFLSPLWMFRRRLLIPLSVLVTLSSLWLGARLVLPLQIMLVILTIFRVINLLRVRKARMHTRYLWKVTSTTAVYLAIFHLVGLWLYVLSTLFAPYQLLVALCIVQLTAAFAICFITLKNVLKLRFKMPELYLSDKELPTVTVAIPARYETTDLHECLDAILANDYPKLEVIVLDETPHSKTAEIIRDYAHDGVRFVQGIEPDQRWLAKNLAYQKLSREASGDLILFCGVDTRLGKRTIRAMVNVLYARNKTMLSVMPLRDKSTATAAFLQPMRYWWELSLPRRLFNRPPVLSTCWLIDKDALHKLGGFDAVSHTITPEGYFARELVKTDQYSFIRTSGELDVRTVKNFFEQRQTAIRVRYPQLRRRLELVLLLSIIEVIVLLLPFVLAITGFWWLPGGLIAISAVSCSVLVITHTMILQVSNPANVPLGFFNFPMVVLFELLIGYTSMIKYEFLNVEWKQRDISEPVMHVVPKLPALK